jgi:hypothetical protein
MKAELVEGVRLHLQSVEKKKFAVSIGTAIAFLVTFGWFMWEIRGRLDDLVVGQAQVHKDLNYKVSVGQFGKWSYQLERANRTIDPAKGLVVPEAPEAAASASAAASPESP